MELFDKLLRGTKKTPSNIEKLEQWAQKNFNQESLATDKEVSVLDGLILVNEEAGIVKNKSGDEFTVSLHDGKIRITRRFTENEIVDIVKSHPTAK